MHRVLSLLLLLVLPFALHAQPPRKPHPFIPTIPELSDEEEKQIDEIIDRFILYDTGKLRGAEGQAALAAFQKLGPEAIPALIRGLNRSAAINHSCPVTVIAAKLQRFFGSTMDLKMLDYARDEIGAGVGRTVHAAVIQDLRFFCTRQRSYLVRSGVRPITAAQATLRSMKTEAIIEQLQKERGEKLRSLLGELGQRNGDEVINMLGICAGSYERDSQQAARTALGSVLGRLRNDELKGRLKDEKAEIRLAAVKVVSAKQLPFGSELIDRLDDEDATVRLWARGSLVRLARNLIDFGPAPTASKTERELAVKRWREWWQKQGVR